MEESKFLVDIVFGVLGSVLMTFFIFWFVGVNKAQKEHESKINDGIIKQIVNEKDNRIQDKELAEAKSKTERVKKDFYKTSKELAQTMTDLGSSQKDNHALIKENLILIKQNMHRIESLENKQDFVIKEIISNKE